MAKEKIIYLDNASTTPVDPIVLKRMTPYFSEKYGNPSSLYSLGENNHRAIEKARWQLADFLNCSPKEVYFTGSATESNNWIISGLLQNGDSKIRPHFITSAIEHKAVLEPGKVLAERGLIELTILPVNRQGIVKIEDLKKSIKKNTRLISIAYVNNEIGTIQPVGKISRLINRLNRKRREPIYFHTDAVQAANYLDCRVNYLKADAMSFSSHKIYGPKGVGALYLKEGTPIVSLIRGGGQERGMRSGTENIAGIVGFGEAIKKIKNHRLRIKNTLRLRNRLIKGILESIPNVRLNGSLKNRLPNNANFSFRGAEGESIILELAQKRIAASTGSACASHSLSPSHVLLAIGLSHEQAHGSVRFSLGRQTTQRDIDYTIKILPGIITRLRKISGR